MFLLFSAHDYYFYKNGALAPIGHRDRDRQRIVDVGTVSLCAVALRVVRGGGLESWLIC